MTLDERLENVSIVGAAGKMGSGIAVLIAQEMAKLKLAPGNKSKIYRLNLIDISESALDGLRSYMKAQLIKAAEKSVVMLRDIYQEQSDLIENADIINAFVDEAYSTLNFTCDISAAYKSFLVFEAIVENEKIKIKMYKDFKKKCISDAYFFTNTSSIPIGFLDQKSDLGGRLIGYHFYNPPVVQKLVEVIPGDHTVEPLRQLAEELGKRLRKKLVPSNDVSGFIGNGHFMRDALHALDEVLNLKGKYKFPGAVYIMNRISQDFLVRPMGIFQLIDYVGIDVTQCILKVMGTHLNNRILHSKLIDKIVKAGVRGGQYADGSQRDGFLKYEKNRPVGIYDIKTQQYMIIEDEWRNKIDKKLGALPDGFLPWKALLTNLKKDELLALHFTNLKNLNTMGSELAVKYLKRSKEIGEKLISDGVAKSKEDVNAVLTNGFYWLYGPINEYI